MSENMLARLRAIDTDTHITEPPDVWTARLSTNRCCLTGTGTHSGPQSGTSIFRSASISAQAISAT